MVNFSKGIKGLNENIAVALLFLSYITLIELTESVEARDKGDDIILSKGKIIMRGGKGKGKCEKSLTNYIDFLDQNQSDQHASQVNK